MAYSDSDIRSVADKIRGLELTIGEQAALGAAISALGDDVRGFSATPDQPLGYLIITLENCLTAGKPAGAVAKIASPIKGISLGRENSIEC